MGIILQVRSQANVTLNAIPPLKQLTLAEPAVVQKVVKAFAPATVANLGPGYDFLGCAVEGLGDFVTAEVPLCMFCNFLSDIQHPFHCKIQFRAIFLFSAYEIGVQFLWAHSELMGLKREGE